MSVNRVDYGGSTLIDLTSDTITADKLYKGYTAHAADGSAITGSLATAPLEPYITELNQGYVEAGTWKYENPTGTYADMYEVKADHRYFISLGANVGSRFRVMFTTTDISTVTENVVGSSVISTNNPAVYANTKYTPTDDGYLVIAKDNVGKKGVKTYVFDTSNWL